MIGDTQSLDPLIFGYGDLVSITFGIAFSALGLVANPYNRTAGRLITLMASGFSLGTFALVLISPFSQIAAEAFGIHLNLLEIVVREGKLTFYLGSVIASIVLVREIFFKPPLPVD